MKNICVYGSVNNKIDSTYIKYAEELGKKISDKNFNLIFGGMKNGLLGGVARGFYNAKNSKIIAIMPEFFKETKKDEIFNSCDEIIYTKNINERKEKFKEIADAIVVLPGGVGTFDEFFDAVCSKRWGYCDIPIVIYNINHYYDKLISMLNYSIEEKFGKDNYNETYKVFENINDIFSYLNEF